MEKQGSSPEGPLFLCEVLQQEYKRLHGEPLDAERQLKERYDDYLELQEKTIRNHINEEEPGRRQNINGKLVPEIYKLIHDLPPGQKRAALCLSGGGIRSATFALGLLQGLARCGLLHKFDYLSTVSGGGFIGSWLTAWIYHTWKRLGGKPGDRYRSLKLVEEKLWKATADPLAPEPQEIRHLRAYSHYLAPWMGVLSADTWTLAGTYLRNLLINWIVIIPLLAAVLMIPRLCVAVINHTGQNWVRVTVFLLGMLSGAWAIGFTGINRPSSTRAEKVDEEGGGQESSWRQKIALFMGSTTSRKLQGRSADQGRFLLWCLLPLTLSAVLLTTYWAWISQLHPVPDFLHQDFPSLSYLWHFILVGFCLHILGWSGYSSTKLYRWHLNNKKKFWELPDKRESGTFEAVWEVFRKESAEFLVVAACSFLGGSLAWLAALKILPPHPFPSETVSPTYVCLAVPFFLAVYLLAATLFVGLVSRFTEDVDREWFARAGSWVLIVIIFWGGVSALVIFGPVLLLKSPYIYGSIGGIAGLFSTLLGWSALTEALQEKSRSRGWQVWLLKTFMGLAALVFLMVLIAALSLGTSWLLKCLPDTVIVFQPPLNFTQSWDILHLSTINSTPLLPAVLICSVLLIFGTVMSIAINTNKFSLHGMYRSRLIRAYLGASRPQQGRKTDSFPGVSPDAPEERNPDPFTGFDPKDNIEMGKLLPQDEAGTLKKLGGNKGNKLLHIVNTTLNLVYGQELAWQQRKGTSFTISPLHCGCHRLGYRPSLKYGKFPKWTVPHQDSSQHEHREEAITLGTAVSISGAGVSPNMGYYSSPVIGFLLTLFNLRLGCWLGNSGPAGNKTYPFSQRKCSVLSIIQEAFGLTDDQRGFVYLSDGGHFDNLGLYEMVLRRCRYIVVSDAGCDPKYVFEDLGSAIHKIRVDFGIPITFEHGIDIHAWNDQKNRLKRKICAIGTIGYSQVDGTGSRKDKDLDGILIYIKPAMCGDEPVDIVNYRKANPQFPHESTGDQFFSETQFESYRMLGLHAMEKMTNFAELERFEDFIERVRAYLKRNESGDRL
jgi:hypothetical protein